MRSSLRTAAGSRSPRTSRGWQEKWYVAPVEGPLQQVARVAWRAASCPAGVGIGLRIFYFEPMSLRVVSADVNGSGPELQGRRGSPAFHNVRPAGPRAFFDVLPTDEPRFLVNTLLGQTEQAPVTLLVNWPVPAQTVSRRGRHLQPTSRLLNVSASLRNVVTCGRVPPDSAAFSVPQAPRTAVARPRRRRRRLRASQPAFVTAPGFRLPAPGSGSRRWPPGALLPDLR